MKRRRTVLTLACAAALLLQVFLPGGAPLLRVQGEGVAGGQEGGASLSEKGDTYAAYLARYADAARPRLPEDIRRAAGDFQAIEPEGGYEVLSGYAGRDQALLVQSGLQYVDYALEVPQAGLYNLLVEHHPMDTDSKRYELGVQINGETPFSQASSLTISNTYEPAGQAVITDSSGDQFAANRAIRQDWTDSRLTNPDGDYDDPLLFYLRQGTNVVRLIFSASDALVLGGVRVCEEEAPPSYAAYRAQQPGGDTGKALIQTEAEAATLQSDSTLRPESDRTDRATSPYSAKNMLINIIGTTWSAHGQWLEWTIKVEESGYYRLSFRYQQEALKGLPVGRRLSIDGAVPFAEAACLRFPYTSRWDLLTAADGEGEPYLFYLPAGTHTLRLEAVLGELAPIIRQLNDVIYSLNQWYRKIIMITSTSADKYRDYNLDREIPGLLEGLTDCANRLRDGYNAICAVAGGEAAECAILMTTVRQLESFVSEPRTIPYRITSFQSNIGSVSAWVLDIRNQPLMLDYFLLWQEGAALPKTTSNLWDSIAHSASLFFYSFVQDYNGFSAKEADKSISLWLGTGRDQAEVLWKMTTDLFTPKSGIHVNIKLVSATMVEAFLSGNTPDVAINTTRDTPVNLAVRSALLDLAAFPDFEDVTGWFQPGALTPYSFQNSVYGLPDTQTFNMLFYRKDIFEELGLTVPQTWDDFIETASQLHLYKLEAGIPVTSVASAASAAGDASMYYTLLMQNGGTVFSDDLSRTLLDSDPSQKAFSLWTDLYTKVGLPVSYDFFNRFRSAEVPMAVVAYNNYNQLASAAPELRGLWEMAPIPGTRQSDGTISRVQSASGTAAVILSSTSKPEEAWSFIKWWAGAQAQGRYAGDLESKIGVIARVPVANKDAFGALDWDPKTAGLLAEQWAQVREIPQVPGNYYLDRDLINAFRDVVYNGRNSLEAIQEYGRRINGEIARKREEFGLA